jgi:chromosomal replication initiation ATPase DnaA
MTEEELSKELEENERIMIKCVCDTLYNYSSKIRVYLADFVCALCNVDKEKMLSGKNEHDVAQARALYWYAYRYMTGETYEHIGRISKDVYGKEFTTVGVANGVNKMYALIEQQPIWKKRWNVIKRIIKTQNAMVVEQNVPITITVPKNVEITIKKE